MSNIVSKDILCYILKFFKINGVPLKHIHDLRNIYNSSKFIRTCMTKEQLITVESWKSLINKHMKQLQRSRHKKLAYLSEISSYSHSYKYLRCSLCFCKYPYLSGSVHSKHGCPLRAEFCQTHNGGSKLYPACLFDDSELKLSSSKRKCKLCNLDKN
jgi:hypothetical protein